MAIEKELIKEKIRLETMISNIRASLDNANEMYTEVLDKLNNLKKNGKGN